MKIKKKLITFLFDDGTYQKLEIEKVNIVQSNEPDFFKLQYMDNGTFQLTVNEKSIFLPMLRNSDQIELSTEEC